MTDEQVVATIPRGKGRFQCLRVVRRRWGRHRLLRVEPVSLRTGKRSGPGLTLGLLDWARLLPHLQAALHEEASEK